MNLFDTTLRVPHQWVFCEGFEFKASLPVVSCLSVKPPHAKSPPIGFCPPKHVQDTSNASQGSAMMLPPPGSLPWHVACAWSPHFVPHTPWAQRALELPFTSARCLRGLESSPQSRSCPQPSPSALSNGDGQAGQELSFDLWQLPLPEMDFPPQTSLSLAATVSRLHLAHRAGASGLWNEQGGAFTLSPPTRSGGQLVVREPGPTAGRAGWLAGLSVL